jgi:hypothetical protein
MFPARYGTSSAQVRARFDNRFSRRFSGRQEVRRGVLVSSSPSTKTANVVPPGRRDDSYAVAPLDRVDSCPVPRLLVAWTVHVYVRPCVRPDMVIGPAARVTDCTPLRVDVGAQVAV